MKFSLFPLKRDSTIGRTYQVARHPACTNSFMFTDRDFYRSVLAGALESFGLDDLAARLNVPALEVARWAQGRTRPPALLILQVIDLMWASPEAPLRKD
jgi:hypothetical protein